jgi:hypothetical protein
MAGKHTAGELTDEQRRHLLEDLAAIQAKGPLPPSLKGLQERLTAGAGKREAA